MRCGNHCADLVPSSNRNVFVLFAYFASIAKQKNM